MSACRKTVPFLENRAEWRHHARPEHTHSRLLPEGRSIPFRFDESGGLEYVLVFCSKSIIDHDIRFGSGFIVFSYFRFRFSERAGIGSYFTYDGLDYRITSDATVEVTGLGDTGLNEITVPSSVIYSSERYDVTSIGNRAFYNCSGLTSVTITEGITSIGDCSIYNCSGMISISISEGVTSIGYSAFEGCTVMTFVEIPEGVVSIGYAFSNCASLTSVAIPGGATSISNSSSRAVRARFLLLYRERRTYGL
ncbi:MAG: leucine-rich repeat domain-containing protein [Candidatus Methanomethylophilaceae archaeon]